MSPGLRILAPTRYPWQFNSPRKSRHNILVRPFLPLNKISQKIEGVTIFNPLSARGCDLVHAFNRIPIGNKPFVIGFESHLPRGFGIEQTTFFKSMAKVLASERCRQIIAISKYAKRQFLRQHRQSEWFGALESKCIVRYPSFDLPEVTDGFVFKESQPLRLLFIGNHFGRKGGSVGVRFAKLAQNHGLNVEVEIVSALEIGKSSWVDPLRKAYWQKDLTLMHTLPNIKFHGSLPNATVLEKIRTAHFVLLPTMSDSFGYTAIEAMANFTPVIGTAQGALPEFITNGSNGILLPLETDEYGEWKHISHPNRYSKAYEEIYDRTIDELAGALFEEANKINRDPEKYLEMRKMARQGAEQMFCSKGANLFWDNLYESSIKRA